MKLSSVKSPVHVLLLSLALAGLFLGAFLSARLIEPSLPEVKQLDLRTIDPTLFSVDEWYIPFYLANFSTVANSVVDSGKDKGFINIPVWRSLQDNKPHNARIMESILSLAWFYTHQRPWNVYYSDAALKERLEAALTFWCDIQNSDGRFSEYAPKQWSLAPTAFATKFVGRALYLLKDGPPIDAAIMERTRQAMRKAIYVTLTDASLWEHGRNYTNQFENVWGGAFMYLKKYPDKELEALVHKRLEESMNEFQSPVGYFYEKNGPDWGYNLSTHHSDLHVAWHFVKGTPLQKYFQEKTKKWYDWFSYNALKEPGSNVYYLNKAIETRQQRWAIKTDTLENPSAARWTPQAEVIPEARAFILSREEYAKATQLYYAQMKNKYPQTGELKKGEFSSFSPYAFLHSELVNWMPSDAEKKQAVENLPYLKNENFNEIRKDNRNNTVHSFARRPAYYAIFNGGEILTPTQRYGLGLLWNSQMGTVLQSQSNSDIASWGTRADGTTQVYEAGNVPIEFKIGSKVWQPAEGRNQTPGIFSVTYPLKNSGSKTIEFGKNTVSVTVEHGGSFTEIIPLLIEKDAEVKSTNKSITLQTKKGKLTIWLKGATGVKKLDQNISTRSSKPCNVFEIQANDKLEYEFSFR